MPTDITISTDKPSYLTTGPIAITSGGAYSVVQPTVTAPTTTGQNFLIPSNLGDKPSLLRVQPFCSTTTTAPTNANFTGGCFRVVGYTTYTQTVGTVVYIPSVIAEIQVELTTGTVSTLAVDGVNHYWFSKLTAVAGYPTVNLYTPATGTASLVEPAEALIDTTGHQYIMLQFKGTNLSTPKMGAFYGYI